MKTLRQQNHLVKITQSCVRQKTALRFLALWLWAGDLLSLNLCFHNYKKGPKLSTSQSCWNHQMILWDFSKPLTSATTNLYLTHYHLSFCLAESSAKPFMWNSGPSFLQNHWGFLSKRGGQDDFGPHIPELLSDRTSSSLKSHWLLISFLSCQETNTRGLFYGTVWQIISLPSTKARVHCRDI